MFFGHQILFWQGLSYEISYRTPNRKTHQNKILDYKLSKKIINQEYNFKDNLNIEKINSPYFNNNQEVFWKEMLTSP
jgi:hypothetical protein